MLPPLPGRWCFVVNTMLVGAGSVGEVIARHLVGDSRISLSLLDLDEARLRVLRRRLGGRKISTYTADIAKASEFEEIVKGHELLVNAATPRLNKFLMDICLKHGLNYIDLASDDLRQQLSQHTRWRRKGLKALICLGEDPGLSNIYVKLAAGRLKNIVAVKVRDGEFSKSRKYDIAPLFSPQVFFGELLNPAYVYVNGRYRRMPPLSGREIYEFPEPVGKQTVYSMSHEEVFTLPRYFKSLKYVDFKLNLSEEFVHSVKLLKKLGILSSRRVRVRGVRVSPRDVFLTLLPKPYDVAGKVEGYAALAVEAVGREGGVRKELTLFTYMGHEEAYSLFRTNATAYLTGTVPAVVASMVARNMVEESGVLTPEMLEPEPIIKLLSEKHVKSFVKTAEEGVLPLS
jgi:saccharopine dehydrogenase (NAD+, L-lysine-forming)